MVFSCGFYNSFPLKRIIRPRIRNVIYMKRRVTLPKDRDKRDSLVPHDSDQVDMKQREEDATCVV